MYKYNLIKQQRLQHTHDFFLNKDTKGFEIPGEEEAPSVKSASHPELCGNTVTMTAALLLTH